MNTQPEALRLADALVGMVETTDAWSDKQVNKAADELRRLHEVNQELLEALKDLLDDADPCDCTEESDWCPLLAARAAIAKAEAA